MFYIAVQSILVLQFLYVDMRTLEAKNVQFQDKNLMTIVEENTLWLFLKDFLCINTYENKRL